jgi:methylisocitrate lyase
MKKTTVLKDLLKRPGLLSFPVCFDPLAARIAEKMGFKVIALGGFAFGADTCLTEPLTTMTETVERSRYIAHSVSIPLIVDAGAGYGEPIHVVRCVEEFERAGVAGIHIEDQVFPKRVHYHRDYKEHTIPEEEMVEKIKFACEARDDPDFVIIARTDTLRTQGLEAAVRRANACAEAGADMVMLFPNNLEETKALPKKTKAPLIYVNGIGNRVGRPVLTAQQAEEYGYKMLYDAIAAILVTYKALRDLFQKLAKEGTTGLSQEMMMPLRKELEDVIGLPRYYAIEEKTTEKH